MARDPILGKRRTTGLESVRAVICDVDGVLTDGGILMADDGSEMKRFHVWDGAAVKFLLQSGIQVGFLTGRTSGVVAHRAKELGVQHIRQGATEKLAAFEELLAAMGVAASEACYMGDDLPDLPLMRRAGYSAAPADAREEVRAAADYVTHVPAGQGAVREIAERILKAQGKWAEVLRRYAQEC